MNDTRPGYTGELAGLLAQSGAEPTAQEIALWLSKAIWRQQVEMNCLDATSTLLAALSTIGLDARIVPVAVIAEHNPTMYRAVSGDAAVRFLAERDGLVPGQPLPERPADSPDFWVDGGHAVVICEEAGLLLDPTADQFGVEDSPFVHGALDEGDAEADIWSFDTGPAGSPTGRIIYLEVDDQIRIDEVAQSISAISGRELAFVGATVGFDPRVVNQNDFPVYPTSSFLNAIAGELDRGDDRILQELRRQRALGMAALGHDRPVPDSWGVASPPEAF